MDRIGGGYPPLLARPKTQSRGALRRLGRWLGVCILVGVILSWMVVLPLRWIDPPATAFMLQDDSRRETILYEWSAWSDIGVASPIAVVAAEDQKFSSHFGFDLKSIQQSVEEHADGASLRGASTITQQVAKNLYLWSGRNFLRKGIEAYFTVLLEVALSKKRILEIYLNIAEFGPGIYGVRAASETYFGKAPNELTDAEAALLAAVLPNPKRLHAGNPSAYVRQRQSWIMQQMQRLRRERWIYSLQ